MGKTPGIVLPSFFASQQELEGDVRRRGDEAGFTPFDGTDILHADDVIEEFLAHYGVKGMRWGVRRQANKDAKETARAKQFYGEGAGTRRKLIKAKVEGRSKVSEKYSKAYAESLAKQNSSKHAEKAIAERRRKDVSKKTKQTTGYVARRLTGEMGTTAAFTALAIGGAAFLRSPKGQALVNKGIEKIRSSQQARAGAKLVTDFIKSRGG